MNPDGAHEMLSSSKMMMTILMMKKGDAAWPKKVMQDGHMKVEMKGEQVKSTL